MRCFRQFWKADIEPTTLANGKSGKAATTSTVPDAEGAIDLKVPLLESMAATPSRLASLCAFQDVASAVGMTPLVRLNRVTKDCVATVYAKLEFLSVGGSIKDRIAAKIIEAAEASGEIAPDRSVLIEGTSGNTGIGLAMVAAAKGYRCIITMPQTPTVTERYMICRAHGAEVHLSDPSEGATGFNKLAEEIAQRTPGAFMMRQFRNQDNVLAHFEGTGPEILAQTKGLVDVFVAGAGTGGTVTGVSRFLKQQKPGVHIVCVEPAESRVLAGKDPPGYKAHGLTGIGAGITLPLVDEEVKFAKQGTETDACYAGVIDEFAEVPSSKGISMARRLAEQEGLLVGPSSGGACVAALELAKQPHRKGQVIVVIFPSSGSRYLQHPMFDRLKDETTRALPQCNFCSPENWR